MITLLLVNLLTALAALMMWLKGPEISEIHQITSRKIYRFFQVKILDPLIVEILKFYEW